MDSTLLKNWRVTVQIAPDLFEYKEKAHSLHVQMSTFDAGHSYASCFRGTSASLHVGRSYASCIRGISASMHVTIGQIRGELNSCYG